MKNILLLYLVVLIVCSCNKKKDKNTIDVLDWAYAQNYYLENIENTIAYLEELKILGADHASSKSVFKKARIAFKKGEPYASYLNPDVGYRVNGPALPIFKEDNLKTLKPFGLQKIEESIYEGETSVADFQNEVNITLGMLENLRRNIKKRKLNPQRFFISTHQQLFRIISLGISGFDTPMSQLGIKESAISLKSLNTIYENSIQFIIKKKNPELDKTFQNHITKAIAFINSNTDFETFDRFTFIKDYMNPITRNWVNIRKESGLWEGVKNKPFNFDAETFFDEDAFNVAYFTPKVNLNPTEKQIELGKKLFFEPKLSAKGTMACATCHQPEKAYADGMVANLDNEGKPLERNTPTLINSVFQQSLFLDGRSGNLLDQISAVFTNDKEFNSNVHLFSTEILQDTSYISLFEKAYGGISKRNTEVIKAISSYVSTLNGFNSKFDRNIRNEEQTFTEEEKLGFNLYMGKGLCATCHFIPLTNGTVPPFFAETEKEVIGVPETAKNEKLDDDLGYYWKYKEELHRGMFKTPTVRNAALTAPYMHNGVYNALEEVMDFYNLGGGGGMGFDLEHQTLPFDNLQLNDEELDALVAFIETLTDEKVDSY